MRDMWYGLDGKPISMAEAEVLLASPVDRQVARTMIVTERGRIEVSTIHLVLDHGYVNGAAPVLWETMVFEGPEDGSMWRYQSRAEARAGHDEAVALTRSALDVEGVAILATETREGKA